MDVRFRLLKGKLLEEIERDPEYSRLLGLRGRTSFREKTPKAEETPTESVNNLFPDPDIKGGT